MEENMQKIDVIIPVYKPDKNFLELLNRIKHQSVAIHQIIIMNTEQKYWEALSYDYPQIMKNDHMKVYHLSRREFDHGGTRRAGVKKSKADFFVMMTQDAIPADEYLIEKLIAPFQEPEVAVSYARQLPRQDAGPVEKFTREFNYPDRSAVKTKADIEKLGIKTYFCSNVCAAYKRTVYDKTDGFIRHAIFNEDMIYAASCIEQGYSIAYAADARVIHSHQYTNKQQFHRNFDLGVSQAEHPEVFGAVTSESEGIKMVKQTIKYLRSQGESRWIIPMCITSGYKLFGYKLGKNYKKLSARRILKYAMNKEYFKQKGY